MPQGGQNLCWSVPCALKFSHWCLNPGFTISVSRLNHGVVRNVNFSGAKMNSCLTHHAYMAQSAAIIVAAQNILPIDALPVRDALAYAYIGKPQASLLAFLRQGMRIPLNSYNSLKFRSKLAKYKTWRSADAISALHAGVTVDIDIKLASDAIRNQALDEIFDVSVQVIGAEPSIIAEEPWFILPTFKAADGG